MTPAQRARIAADFAALDGTRCERCGLYRRTRVTKRQIWTGLCQLGMGYEAMVSCDCADITTHARTRYRAVAMALVAYRAAQKEAK